MKLNELVKNMFGVGVNVVNNEDYKTIYKGSTTGIKINSKEFEKYNVSTIFASVETSYALTIYVEEVK